LLTLIIVIGLTSVAIVIFLIPVLGGRDESPSPSISDSDDSRLIGAGFDDRAKAERLIEYEVKPNPATNADFIKKIIWIAAIAVAVFAFFYVSLL
jgi:hypothetical protein